MANQTQEDIALAGSAAKGGLGIAKFFEIIPPGAVSVAPVVGGVISIAGTAASDLPDSTKALVAADTAAKTAGTIALIATIGSAAAGFAGVIGLALAPLVSEVIQRVARLFQSKHVPHIVRESIEIQRDVNVMVNTFFPLIRASGSYDELWKSFDYSRTQGFADDIGGPILIKDPANNQWVNNNNKAAFLRMVESGKVEFGWQHGIALEKVNVMNNALNNVVKNQAELIRRAWGGDKTAAEAIFQARKTWAVNHGHVFGRMAETFLSGQELADYKKRKAETEYMVTHPTGDNIGPRDLFDPTQMGGGDGGGAGAP